MPVGKGSIARAAQAKKSNTVEKPTKKKVEVVTKKDPAVRKSVLTTKIDPKRGIRCDLPDYLL